MTVPHRRQRGPAIQQQRLCRSAPLGLLWTSFFLSFFLSRPLFSEPIFLSEVLIWGTGQWARGPREGRTGGEGAEEVQCGDGCRWTALCSSFPRLLSRASEAPVALESSREIERRREREKLWRETRTQCTVQLESPHIKHRGIKWRLAKDKLNIKLFNMCCRNEQHWLQMKTTQMKDK